MSENQFVSPVLADFDPKGYHFFGLWKQNLFSACFWVSGWNEDTIEKLGIDAKEAGILILCDGNFFVKNIEIANIKRQIFEKINKKDKQFFENMVNVANIEYKVAVEYAKSIRGKELTPETFLEFITVARRVNFLWFLGAEQFSEAAEEKLSNVVVQEAFPAEQVFDIIPKFNTPLNDQQKEIIELKKEVGNRSYEMVRRTDPELLAKLEDHTERFAWIEIANFVGESLTVERVWEQIIHVDIEPVHKTESNHKVSNDLAFHAYCMSCSGYLRQAGAEYYAMLSEKALPYLKAIAKKFDLTYSEFLLQRETEILDALKGNLSADDLKRNAKRRERMNFVMFAGLGSGVLFTEERDDIEILKQNMLPQIEKGGKELKGQVGNKGAYTGHVCIIMNTHDFIKMQPGNVLVSTMTTPDFVVLMHKAGAIVTDIGGLLCHAAIVSRELNKPCVIGTKFATQVLKDGDMVEVDADEGIVRILK